VIEVRDFSNCPIGDGAGSRSSAYGHNQYAPDDNVARVLAAPYTEFGEVTLFEDNFRITATRGGGVLLAKPLRRRIPCSCRSAARGGGVLFQAGVSRVTNAVCPQRRVDQPGRGDLYQRYAVIVAATTIASPTVAAGSAIYVDRHAQLRHDHRQPHTRDHGRPESRNFNPSTGLRAGASFRWGLLFTATAGFVDLSAGTITWRPGAPPRRRHPRRDELDFEGDPRPMGGGFDIGYDEFRPLSFLPLVRR
jgi:hypothetical protein